MDAKELALRAHGKQTYGDLPYAVHLERVVALVQGYGKVVEDIAWLHDTLEDTGLLVTEIECHCGPEVARGVMLLTDPPGRNRKERKAKMNSCLASIAVDSPDARVLLVKAADRLANVESSVQARLLPLVEMYRKEQAAFREAVYRAGFNDRFIEAAEALLGMVHA